MKYAHLADLHLGSWRDPQMRDLSTKAFLSAMDSCIQQQVDFILFAGDLFNTSLPSFDTLKMVTKKLRELKDRKIPLYVIAGSHDFSPSGKTMIDVLEQARLLKNVCRGTVDPQTKQLRLSFTIDPKTGAKMTGMLGKKGQLDRSYYENLHLENLEKELGYKIFMFHTSVTELKPKHLDNIESQPVSFLPKGFQYYAGGHLHHPTTIEIPEYGTLTYPGALFPNNFAEIEKYSHGGYNLVTVHSEKREDASSLINQQQTVQWFPVIVAPHHKLILDCSHKSPDIVTFEILDFFKDKELANSIITLRLTGTLAGGKPTDINFREILSQLQGRGAYFIMKNTAQLNASEFAEIKIAPGEENLEDELIREHLQQNKLFDAETEFHVTKQLLLAMNTSKKEGETVTDFQARVESEVNKLLNLQMT